MKGRRGAPQRCLGRGHAVVTLLLVTLHLSSAFFLNTRTGKQAAKKPIDEECMAKARSGDCAFYLCFDERHPCSSIGSNSYAITYGLKFCSRFDDHKRELTSEGRRWLDGTRLCSMEKMLDLYREESISCSKVEEEMKEWHAACEAENGLCQGQLLSENKEVFSYVYELDAQSVIRFLYSVKQCAGSKLSEVTAWFSDQLHDVDEASRSVLPLFKDLEKQAKTFKENMEEKFNQIRDTFQLFGKTLLSRKSSNDVD